MSYYMGDYYPRGDPGIGSFFLGLAKKAVGFIPGVGPAISAIMPGGAKTAAAKLPGLQPMYASQLVTRGAAMVKQHPILSAAGGAALAGMGAGALAERAMVPGATYAPGHKGRVLKHCGLVLKSGKIGKCHRRMNPFNPRAARRAGRRIHSLIRHYKKYVGFVSARKPKGRPYFKARRRK
jgi:hypothetical protein